MFLFAKRESKEEHVARKQQKIQIKADFFGIWEFMILNSPRSGLQTRRSAAPYSAASSVKALFISADFCS